MEPVIWAYALVSVLIISSISLVGIVTLSLSDKVMRKLLQFLVSFAAGGLFGGAFFHLIPEAAEDGFGLHIPIAIMLGLLVFLMLESFIHWRHCHVPTSKSHPHPLGIMNIIGDGFHNLIDGLVIGGAYLASIPLGIATTIAVLFHEVPQEMGDFGILIHAGFSKAKALLFNFLSALAAFVGVVISIIIGTRIGGFVEFLIPFTAGGFIYIAGSDIIPEMRKECEPSKSLFQFIALVLGIVVMILLVFLE
jgi:zinc and cadmium transporter